MLVCHSRMFFTSCKQPNQYSKHPSQTPSTRMMTSFNKDYGNNGINSFLSAPTQSIQLIVVIDALDECDSMQDI